MSRPTFRKEQSLYQGRPSEGECPDTTDLLEKSTPPADATRATTFCSEVRFCSEVGSSPPTVKLLAVWMSAEPPSPPGGHHLALVLETRDSLHCFDHRPHREIAIVAQLERCAGSPRWGSPSRRNFGHCEWGVHAFAPRTWVANSIASPRTTARAYFAGREHLSELETETGGGGGARPSLTEASVSRPLTGSRSYQG